MGKIILQKYYIIQNITLKSNNINLIGSIKYLEHTTSHAKVVN